MKVSIPIEFELVQRMPSSDEVMAAIQKCLDPRFVAQEPTPTTPPAIGEYWLGQGGIYAGIARGRDGQPDYHLILAELPATKDLKWQAALDMAKIVAVDGHSDFTVPTRFESALLYANLQDKFDTNYWYWTSTQYSESHAWGQLFHDGTQITLNKDDERRCRFVRRSVL